MWTSAGQTTISPISSLSTINTIRSTSTHLDGQEYRVVSRVEYSKKDEIKVGSYEVLFVDEKNPRYFSRPSENRGTCNQRPLSGLCWELPLHFFL